VLEQKEDKRNDQPSGKNWLKSYAWWNRYGYLLVTPIFLYIYFENYVLLCVGNGDDMTIVSDQTTPSRFKIGDAANIQFYVALTVICYVVSAYFYMEAIDDFMSIKHFVTSTAPPREILRNEWSYRLLVSFTSSRVMISLPVVVTHFLFAFSFISLHRHCTVCASSGENTVRGVRYIC
jgi:hypothetical protein